MKKYFVYIFALFFILGQSTPTFADTKSNDESEVSTILDKENFTEQDSKTLYKYGLKHGKVKNEVMKLENGDSKYLLKTYEIEDKEHNSKILTASTEDLSQIKEQASLIKLFHNNVYAGDYGDGKWDRTSSVYFTLRIYFTTKSTTARLDRIVGKVKKHVQPGVSVKTKIVFFRTLNPAAGVNQQKNKYPTLEFDYKTGFKKYAPKHSSSFIGGTWQTTLKRGSSWTCSFPLYLYK